MQDPQRYTRMLICRNLSSFLPPTKLVSLERFLTLALMADSAIINKLHPAAKAPTNMNIRPKTHPLRPKTYGRESTPEPIAEAHRAKIEPLKDPLSNLPNALYENLLM